jgi:2,5-dihydroxypyridine 5,6-dioxygenase
MQLIYELQKAADTLVNVLFMIQPGETFIITADTETDQRVVDATAQAAYSAGAKVMVVLTPAPLGVSLAADPMLPIDSLSGALQSAQAWAEFNKKWLLYSTPYNNTRRDNKEIRHMCLTGSTEESLINCVGKVNYEILQQYGELLAQKVKQTKHIQMISKNGEDISFDNNPDYPVTCELGHANTPGSHMLPGQIAWTPQLDSINGVIVLDGSIAPGIGLLKIPVKISVKKGCLQSVSGGREAYLYESWLKSFNHPQMLTIAHTGFGLNPGAVLSGDILQDQRVWGSTTWGFGSIGPGLLPPDGIFGPSHSDCVSLNTTVIFDGKTIYQDGEVIDSDLVDLAQQIKKNG